VDVGSRLDHHSATDLRAEESQATDPETGRPGYFIQKEHQFAQIPSRFDQAVTPAIQPASCIE
jgi:hypothetical protein